MAKYSSLDEANRALKIEFSKLDLAFSSACQITTHSREQILVQHDLLRKVEPLFDQENPVTIAMLGESGHGKSTLVNAILGFEVLPTSNSKVCTSGITRVGFKNIDGFKATVKFLSIEAIQEEVQLARRLLLNEIENEPDGDENFSEKRSNPLDLLNESTRVRLEAIFGSAQFEEFLASYGKSEMAFPKEILSAFERSQDLIEESGEHEMRKALANYLVVPKRNSEQANVGNVWPIVQDVLIEGRFSAIAHGAQLVDLPGLNDPNPAREKVTTDFLKEAKFVFIVFQFSRGITKSVQEALKPRDLLKRILQAGKSNSLTFVLTKCDNIEIDSDSDEFNSNPELSTEEITKLIIDDHRMHDFPAELMELSRVLIPGDDKDEEVQALRDSFTQSAIFATAARNYLNIFRERRGERASGEMRFSNEESTGIPELSSHIENLSLQAGPKMLVKNLQNKMIEPANRVISLLINEAATIDLKNGETVAEFQTLINFIKDSRIRTSNVLESYLKQQMEYLQQSSKDFISSITVSPISADKIKKQFETYLFSINHWRTMKAVMQYRGIFYSSSRGMIDVKAQITDPIFDSAFNPWIRFFEKTLTENIEGTKVHLIDLVSDYMESAEYHFPKSETYLQEKESISGSLKQIIENTSAKVEAVKETLNLRILETRTTLLDIVTSSVDQQLDPLISRAALESGTGMMNRIRGSLNGAAANVIENSFSLTRNRIGEEIEKTILEISGIFKEVQDLILWELENFSSRFEVDELSPKPIFDERIPALKKEIVSIAKDIKEAKIWTDWDRANDFEPRVENIDYLIIDGSNVCTNVVRGIEVTSVDILASCRAALVKKYPEKKVVTLVDSAFIHKIKIPSQRERFEALRSQGLVKQIPSYIEGGGDVYILSMANHYNAVVVSDDSYQKHLSRFPFIKEKQRRLTFNQFDGSEWFFYWARP